MIIPIRGAVYAVGDNLQRGGGRLRQRRLQRLALLRGKGGKHPIRQIIVRVGLGAHADLHPREILAAQLGDDGLDPIVPAGGAL